MGTTQRRRSRKGPIATLIAALAFAACTQVLGPASATAMIATGGEAQCNVTPGTNLGQTPSGQPCMVLEGGGIIVFEPAEEEVEVGGTAPPSPEPSPSPIVGFCQRNPIVCSDGEPKPKPGRDGLHEKQTPPRPSGGRTEVKKPPKTDAQKRVRCEELFKTLESGRLAEYYKNVAQDWKEYEENKAYFDWWDPRRKPIITLFYRPVKNYLAEWGKYGCAGRLDKKLDPVYGRS